jgi:hypothetical protein
MNASITRSSFINFQRNISKENVGIELEHLIMNTVKWINEKTDYPYMFIKKQNFVK